MAIVKDEKALEWARVQGELYRIYLHAVTNITRSVAEYGFTSLKQFWLSIVIVVSPSRRP